MHDGEYVAAADRYAEMYRAELAARGEPEPDWAGRGFSTPYREPDAELVSEAEPEAGG